MDKDLDLNYELAMESLLCMSGHAGSLPEANLALYIFCLALAAWFVTWLLGSEHRDAWESKFPHMLPMHSTWIVFTFTLFHADTTVWQ